MYVYIYIYTVINPATVGGVRHHILLLHHLTLWSDWTRLEALKRGSKSRLDNKRLHH